VLGVYLDGLVQCWGISNWKKGLWGGSGEGSCSASVQSNWLTVWNKDSSVKGSC